MRKFLKKSSIDSDKSRGRAAMPWSGELCLRVGSLRGCHNPLTRSIKSSFASNPGSTLLFPAACVTGVYPRLVHPELLLRLRIVVKRDSDSGGKRYQPECVCGAS